MSFPELLNAEMERLGKGMEVTAKAADVSDRVFMNWLEGKNLPSQMTQDSVLRDLRALEKIPSDKVEIKTKWMR